MTNEDDVLADVESQPEKLLIQEFEMKSGDLEDEDWRRKAIRAASSAGDLETVKRLVSEDTSLINTRDRNMWQPIHEAVRGGHVHVIKFLLDHNAEVNGVTRNGGSPLWWARRELPKDHEIIKLLKEFGGRTKRDEL